VARTSFLSSLYLRVLVGIAAGIAVGALAPDTGGQLKPLADGFIRLVMMTIGPLIFCTVVVGIAGMKSMKEVGKAGGLAIAYFEVASTIALAIGLVVVNVVQPGSGMNYTLHAHDAAQVAGVVDKKDSASFVLDIIPELGGH